MKSESIQSWIMSFDARVIQNGEEQSLPKFEDCNDVHVMKIDLINNHNQLWKIYSMNVYCKGYC